MAILLRCACGRQFQTGEENIGRHTHCPTCGRGLVIPLTSPPAEIAEPDGFAPSLLPLAGAAKTSLVLGLLSLVCAGFAGIPAIVMGCRGLSDIRKNRGRVRGRWAAISGIVLGGFGSTVITLALLAAVFQVTREWMRGRQCADNLKEIARGLHDFQFAHGRFPPAAITDRQSRPLLSWRVAILPYLGSEGVDLYRQFHLDEAWDSPHNRTLIDRMPKVFACPDEPTGTPRTTNYLVIMGPSSIFTGKRKGIKIEEITAGTSNTLMVTESDQPVPWTAPQEIPANAIEGSANPGSRHPGGYYVAMADGSVRFWQVIAASK